MLGNLKDSVKEFSSDVKSAVAEKEMEESDVEPLLEEFRLKLLKNNVSLEVAEQIEQELHETLVGETVQRGNVEEKVKEALRERLLDLLDDSFDLDAELEESEDPPVIFLIGFNGSGKTTTAAKLASEYQDRGVVMGAGDTFRAASIEQLEEHGENLEIDVISHEYESDPAAVGYDTVEHAEKNDKIAIVDTAGRSHSDTNLMDELQKMIEVNSPDVTFLVVDALAGNDVLEQADAYEGMFDALIVTKMDVDEKGGAMISLSHRSGKPVAFIGTGQDYEDIREFDREEFVRELLE
jgi:fused signal recognition particle receptor